MHPVLSDVIATFSKVPGVSAIALGGSRSIGTASPHSDFDLVVFMQKPGDIDVRAISATVTAITDGPMNVTKTLALAEFSKQGLKFDVFFRVIDKIATEIEAAASGKFSQNRHPLHPNGFISTVMISYAAYAKPLWDPEGRLARLIASTQPYPELLRQNMISKFRTEAALALRHAAKVEQPDEIAYLAALYAQASSIWSLALFAINRRYPLIDKGAGKILMSLPLHPQNYQTRTTALFHTLLAGDLKDAREKAAMLQKDVFSFD